jgi:hypothetical protein
VHYIPYAKIYNTKKALVFFLELFLVKDLYRKYARFIGVAWNTPISFEGRNIFGYGLQEETLIPVWVQCTLNNWSSPRLLAIYSDDCKRIGKT